MLCKFLKKGMLLKISNPEKRGWFRTESHKKHKRFSDAPPKFVIGPDVVSFVVRLDGVETFVSPGEIFMYLGKKKLKDKKGKIKTFRLVFAKGKIGYIEGRDARFVDPA